MPILNDLWYGNIESHLEEIERTEDERQLLKEAADNLDALMEVLSDDQNEMLTRYISSMDDHHSEVEQRAFKAGFSIATKMIIEALGNTKIAPSPE